MDQCPTTWAVPGACQHRGGPLTTALTTEHWGQAAMGHHVAEVEAEMHRKWHGQPPLSDLRLAWSRLSGRAAQAAQGRHHRQPGTVPRGTAQGGAEVERRQRGRPP